MLLLAERSPAAPFHRVQRLSSGYILDSAPLPSRTAVPSPANSPADIGTGTGPWRLRGTHRIQQRLPGGLCTTSSGAAASLLPAGPPPRDPLPRVGALGARPHVARSGRGRAPAPNFSRGRAAAAASPRPRSLPGGRPVLNERPRRRRPMGAGRRLIFMRRRANERARRLF